LENHIKPHLLVSIDPKSREELEPSQGIILNSLNLIFIQNQQPNIGIALKLRFQNGLQVVIIESEVSHSCGEAGWDTAQAHMGHVNELSSGVEEKAGVEAERVSGNYEVGEGGEVRE